MCKILKLIVAIVTILTKLITNFVRYNNYFSILEAYYNMLLIFLFALFLKLHLKFKYINHLEVFKTKD